MMAELSKQELIWDHKNASTGTGNRSFANMGDIAVF